MTAYGRAEASSSIGHIVIEIQSLNRKFAEVQTHLPRGLMAFDMDIRNLVKEKILRGNISVSVSFFLGEQAEPPLIQPNIPLIKSLQQSWQKTAQAAGIAIDSEAYQKGLVHILYEEKVYNQSPLQLEKSDAVLDLIRAALEQALDSLEIMKKQEGTALFNDITNRLAHIEENLKLIETYATEAEPLFKERLRAKIEEYLEGSVEDDDRLTKEVVIYADKIDITEEIVRFRSHIKQFKEFISKPEEAVGKALDFLVKEMQRELHTMASKSPVSEVAQLVIQNKTEVEKIREQIQNIE